MYAPYKITLSRSNFAGACYLSSDVLRIPSGLQRKVDPVWGSFVLCGLDLLLRDMVRITHMDRARDICGDEVEALGRMLRAYRRWDRGPTTVASFGADRAHLNRRPSLSVDSCSFAIATLGRVDKSWGL